MKLTLASLGAAVAFAMPLAVTQATAYAAAPPAPVVNAVTTQTNGYTVSWQNVQGETRYEVALWVPGDTGIMWKSTRKVARDSTSYFWSAGPGQLMCFQVRAVNTSGSSSWSPPIPMCGSTQPGWRFPWPKGTKAYVGPKNLHGDNFSKIIDPSDSRISYTMSNPLSETALDIVLDPPNSSPSTPSQISATSIAWGKVLAVWPDCRLVLIDHSKVPNLDWSWALYLHLTNITVHAGQVVEAGYPLGKVRNDEKGDDGKPTNTCNVDSTEHHVHLALIRSYTQSSGAYETLRGHYFCRKNEVLWEPPNVVLSGLTTATGQVFSTPC